MAYRRRSAPRRRFTRRRQVRAVTSPRVWNAANFYIDFFHALPPTGPATGLIELAKITEHYGDDTTAAGRTANSMVKSMEIGGIVFANSAWPFTGLFAPEEPEDSRWAVTWALCTINLDVAGGPVVLPNFHLTQWPIALSSANTALVEPMDFPTRIHWREDYIQCIEAVDPAYVPVDNQPRIQRNKNLRLRRAIGPRQGLYLAYTVTPASEGTGDSIHLWTQGTLYYRTKF